MITKEQIARINELAKKSRTESGLTDTEKAEQQKLRREYINAYKENLESQLNYIVIEEPDGTRHHVTKKK